MSPVLVSILALVALFVVGTVLPINMGALGFVAAWLVGMYSLGLTEREIITGMNGDLILTLVGVTYLFAIARNNGTVDLIVRAAVRAVGGRVALIPWVMFAVTAVLTAIGAASPAACAIIGPIALGLRRPLPHQRADDGHDGGPRRAGRRVLPDQHLRGHHQLGHGREQPARQRACHLPRQPAVQPRDRHRPVLRTRRPPVDVAPPRPRRVRRPTGRRVPATTATALAASQAPHRRPRRVDGGTASPSPASGGTATETRADTTDARRRFADQIITLVAFAAVAVVALVFEKNIGFAAITAAVILTALFPKEQKGAIKQIAWPTVLLVAGVSCFAAILSEAGAPEAVGLWAAGLGTVVIGALVLCYVGGITSAFASSTALLPIIVPIAIPLIATGNVGAVAVVAALAVSSTIVDVSPFSTNGALMVANRPDTISEEKYYKQVLYYSVLVTLAGPLLVWAAFVVPGWN